MHNIILQELILYIDGNKSRLKCLVGMVISLLTGSSIYQKGLALGILGDAKATSKTHRIYRFLKDFNFDYMKVGYLLLSFFASKNYVVAMDRTSWKFGKSDINILFLVMVIGKISVPIFWKTLSHGGGCSAEFMKEFLQKFINNFGVERIKYLLADREFMNKEWLDFLINNHLKFVIPLKMDHKIRLTKGLRTLTIERIFSDVKALEYRACSGILWNRKVNFTAYRNDKSELMVLVSSIEIEQDIFALYKFRWSVNDYFCT
ncbi:transposase [Rickettsia endosymbiont of Oedothorax gibbosus]|uniref:transposase n=1 Tax=Rickettsia endosymbiont of Oedothorax gibbosus TaxID=931099 RepID=UPI0020249E78|nr:transposase [Rickettsia endosymbiont of Oedothorax gibbosus]